MAGRSEEEGAVVRFASEERSCFGEVFVDPGGGAFANRDEAVFFAFALADHEGTAFVVEVVELDGAGFSGADACGVEGF